MSNENEAAPAPTSDVAKEAIAALEAKGFKMEGGDPGPAPENEHGLVVEKEAKPTEVPPKEPEKVEDKTPEKPKEGDDVVVRDTSLVPAWKLKVAEKQSKREISDRDTKIAELQNQLKELSEGAPDMTRKETQDALDDIKALAEESGVDETFLTKFATAILSKAKIPEDVSQKLKEIEAEKKASFQEKQFLKEFGDVLPLVKEKYPDISEEQLAKVQQKLHDAAFTENYAKVPLAKIFKAEADDMGIVVTPKKKSGESASSGRARVEGVDFENMDEDTFKNLGPEDKLKFSEYQRKKGGHGWS